ncbi:hypothetical protein PC123_g27046 [Phytophthora cactorum]|nr:hypothetical protein PC123_g27046 [Phytophthora cactorum]
MNVIYVTSDTYEGLLKLIEDEGHQQIPDVKAVPIGMPEDMTTVKQMIKNAGNALLENKKRSREPDSEDTIDRDSIAFEDEICYWSKTDETISYEAFMTVVVENANKFVEGFFVLQIQRLSNHSKDAITSVHYIKECVDSAATIDLDILRMETPESSPYSTPLITN